MGRSRRSSKHPDLVRRAWRHHSARSVEGNRVASSLGTFLVNTTGCLVLGALAGAGAAIPDPALALVGTGFCGALTTFSTFSYETLRLIEQRAYFYATMNALVSVITGLGATLIAYATIAALTGK